MSGLPSGWAATNIAEIGDLVGGKTPSKAEPRFWANGTVPWVSPKDMKVFDLAGSEDQISETAISDGGMNLLPARSILMVTRSGILSHTFPVAITRNPATINQDIKAITPTAAFNTRYLAYNLKSQQRAILNGCAKSGTTVESIETEQLKRLPIPLAPLPEQKRIADKLDSVLARVDACRDRLDRLPALLKRFRQSILAAATSGQLTEDWRDKAPRKWSSARLGSVAKFIDYRGKTPTKTASGTPLITAKNVRRGFISFEPREFISESAYDGWMTRGFPSKGDVLITTEAPLGNVAVINWDFKFALAQRIICLQFNEQIFGSYAAVALQSDQFQAQLIEQSTGSTVAGIKASRLKELQIEIPSIAEQTEIVRRFELLFAFADRLEARLAAARRQVGQLTPALLAKAFRGELVPQDPADEPAAELLKRLAAQRETAPKARRGRASKA
ncbi:restriction endonuclease subunit S [Dechloromonas hortensis]|uniref:restriction endonuclease subunit S n=1 Tax=Dechloromonas hortensis TaxID=337779 RepID=UPI0012915EC2|nr:restriction endonuclease subunit S [Dechloromonas hortensis]